MIYIYFWLAWNFWNFCPFWAFISKNWNKKYVTRSNSPCPSNDQLKISNLICYSFEMAWDAFTLKEIAIINSVHLSRRNEKKKRRNSLCTHGRDVRSYPHTIWYLHVKLYSFLIRPRNDVPTSIKVHQCQQ